MKSLEAYQARWVPISAINSENREFQYRESLHIESLAQSLRDEGQKFPIVLWQRGDTSSPGGGLLIISGFRRFSAAQSLGWDKILGIIIPESAMSYDDALTLNFIENVSRKSLNGIDLRFACKKLKDKGKSNVEIGRLLGKNEKTVRRYLKLTQAPQEIQDAVISGRLPIRNLDSFLSKKVHSARAEAGKGISQGNLNIQKAINDMDELYKTIFNVRQDFSQIHGLYESISGAARKKIQCPPDASTKTGAGSIPLNRMYTKAVGDGGFDLVLKFRPKVDELDDAIGFLRTNLKNLLEIKNESGCESRKMELALPV